MCYRPIHIYNPVRTYNADQPLKIAVPCGKCADCARIKQNEWFFRSLIEFKHYREIGGACYFITLTYDNEHLPTFVTPDGIKQPCFNRHHVRNFIKYLRIWLKRHGYMYKDIKFLICSEYGSNTQRPHYHGLLFMPFHVPNFTQLMQTIWQNGFVICSREGWEIKTISGIRYASKYVSKDFSFYNIPSMNFLNYLSEEERKKFLEEHKDFFPKHWQSVGFGEHFCDVINSQTDIPKYLSNNKVSLWSGSDGIFPIPRYYHLKIEKKINKQYSKILDKVVLERTDIGTKVRDIRLHECVIKDMSNLKYITSDYVRNKLPHISIIHSQFNFLMSNCVQSFTQLQKIFNQRFHVLSDYDSWRDNIVEELPRLLGQLDLHCLSLYRCFLRNMPLFSDECPEHKFNEISDIIKNILYPSVYPPEYQDKIVPSGLSAFSTPLCENFNLRHTTLCKDNDYFAPYEYICKLLDDFDNISSITKEFNYLYNCYMRKKCKQSKGSQPIIYKSLN